MDVEIRTLESQPTMVVRSQIRKDQLGEAFMRDLPKVFRFVMGAGGTPGHPFGRYFDFSDEQVDVEIGVPVDRHVPPQDDVAQSEIPGGRYAVTVHRGAYDDLPATYDALFAWVSANGHSVGGPPFESYVDDPGSTPAEDMRTEVFVPLV